MGEEKNNDMNITTGNDNNQIFSIKPSIKLLYLSTFCYLGAFIIFSILLLLIKNALQGVFANIPNFFGPICSILFVVVIILTIKEYIRISTTYYTLNSKSFVMQSGFFTIKRENMELFRIVDISSQEPFIYRLMGLGTITLRTIDKSDPIVVMSGIENHLEIEKQIKEYSSRKRPTVIESYNSVQDVEIDSPNFD